MSSLFQSQNNFDNPSQKNLLLSVLTDQISLTPARYSQILKFYESLSEAIEDNFEELKHLKLKWLDKIYPIIPDLNAKIQELQASLDKNQISLLSFDDPKYPQSLKILDNYPLVLYTQGNIDTLNDPMMVTVVGSRVIDPYTEIISQQILAPLCKLGIGIVSGLAIGMDGLAHQIALENKAKTVGVIGSGLDQKSFYPMQNWSLKNQILKTGGCVISEYTVGKLPNTYTFPQRNRLLAALTDLTFVVQASVKSGSLITALNARDMGKTLATTPADIRNKNFDGNLKLMKEGCQIITETADIISLMGLKMHPEIQIQTTKQFGSKEEEKIYNLLTISPQNIENLAIISKFDSTTISVALTMLELSSLAMNTGENNWIKMG